MKKNMGAIDRIVRLLIAAVLVILYFTNILTGTLGIVMLVLAGIFLLTSLFSFCPIYWVLGSGTRPKETGK